MMVDPWVFVAVGLGVILVFVAGLMVPRRPRLVRAPVTDTKLDAIYDRLNKVEERQQKNDHDTRNIRMTMAALPTQRSIAELMVQVTSLSGNVSNLAGKVENIKDNLDTNGHTLNRIQDFLFSAAAESLAKHKAD